MGDFMFLLEDVQRKFKTCGDEEIGGELDVALKQVKNVQVA